MSDQDVNNVPQNDFITRKSSNKDGNSHDERANFLVGRGRSKIENQNKSLLNSNVSELHNTKNTKLFQDDDDIVLHHTLGGSVTHTAWSNIKRVLTNPYLKVPHGYKLNKYRKDKEMSLQSSSSYTISTEHNDFNIPQEFCCERWETESNGTQSFASAHGYSLHTPERSQKNVDERQVLRAQMQQTEKRLHHVSDSKLIQVGSHTSDKKPALICENIVIIQTPKEIMRNIIGENREISEDEETIWETGTQNTKNTRISEYQNQNQKQEVSSYETSNTHTHGKHEFVKENSDERCTSDISNNKSDGVSKTSMGSHTKLTFKTETSKASSRSLKLSLESGTSSNRFKISPSVLSLQSIRSIPQVQDVDHAVNRERMLETIQEGSIMTSEESAYMPTSYLHSGQENGMQSNESSQSSLILKWYLSSGKKLRSLLNPEPLQAHKESSATDQYEDDKSTPHVKYTGASNIKSMKLPQGSETRKEIPKFHRTLSPEMEEKGFQACASDKSTERQKYSQQRISWETTLLKKWNSWISQRNSQSSPHSNSEVKNVQRNSNKDVTEQGLSLIQETSKCAPKRKLNDNMKTDAKNEFITAHLETTTISDNITDDNITISLEQTPRKNVEQELNTETDFPNTSKGLTTVQKLSSIKKWFQQRAQISTSVRNQATNKKLEKQNELDDKRTPSQNSHMAKKWIDKRQSLRENQINHKNSLQEISSYENVLLENQKSSPKEKHNKPLENTFAPYSPRGLYTVTSKLQPCSSREHNYEMNLAMRKENSKSIQLAVESATKLRNTLSITSQEISAHRMEQKRNMNENIINKVGKDDRKYSIFTASKPNFITRWFQHDVTVNRAEVPGTSNSKKSLITEESKLSWLGSYVLKKCNEKCQGFMEKYIRLGESKHPNERVIEETCKQGGPTQINLESKKSSKLILRKSARFEEIVNPTQLNFKISLSNQEKNKHKSSTGSHNPKDESNLNLKQKLGRKNKRQMKKSLSTTRYSRSRYTPEINKSTDENLRSVSSCSDVCSISGKRTSLVNFRQYKKGRSKISQRAKIKKLQIPRQISMSNADENGERRNTALSRSGSNRTLLVWCSPNTESLCTVPSFSSTELCERFIQSIEHRNIAPEQLSNTNIILDEKGSHITNKSSPIQSSVAICDTGIKNRKLGTDEDPMKKRLSKENSPPHLIRYRKCHRQKKVQSGYICLHMRDLSTNRKTPKENEITLNPSNPPRRYSSSDDGSHMDCLDPEECECRCDRRTEKMIGKESSTFPLREKASNKEKQNKTQSNKNSFIGKEKVPVTTTSQSTKCPLKQSRDDNHNYSNKSPRREETADYEAEGESLNTNQQARLLECTISQERGIQINTEKKRNQPHKTVCPCAEKYSERGREQDYTSPPKTKGPSKHDSVHEPSTRRKEQRGPHNVSQQRRKQSSCRKTSKERGTQTNREKKRKLSHKRTQYPEELSRKVRKCPIKRKSTSKHDNLEKVTTKRKPEGSHNASEQRRKQSCCRKKSSRNIEDYSSSDHSSCRIRYSKSCPATKQTTCCVCSPENNQSIHGKVTEDRTSQTDKEERQQSSKMIQCSETSLFEGEDKSDMAGSTTKKCPSKRASTHASSHTSRGEISKTKKPISAGQKKKTKCTSRRNSKEKRSQTVKEPRRRSSNKTTQYSQRDMKQGTAKTNKCPFKKASKASSSSNDSSYRSYSDKISLCQCKQEKKQPTDRKVTKDEHSKTDQSSKPNQYSQSSLTGNNKQSDSVKSQSKKYPFTKTSNHDYSLKTPNNKPSSSFTDISLGNIRNSRSCPTVKLSGCICSQEIKQSTNRKATDERASQTEKQTTSTKMTQYSDRSLNKGDDKPDLALPQRKKCPFKSSTDTRASMNSTDQPSSDKRSDKKSLPQIEQKELTCICTHKTRKNDEKKCRKHSKTRVSAKENSSLSHQRCYKESFPRGKSKESSDDSLQTRKSYQMHRSKKAKRRKSTLGDKNLLCLRCAESCPGFQKQKSARICPLKRSSSTSKEETIFQHECLCAKKYNEAVSSEKRKSSSPISKDEVNARHVCLCEERINPSARLEKNKSCPFKKSSSTSNEEITPNQHKCSHCAKMRNKIATLEKEKSEGFSPKKTTSTPKEDRTVHQHECLCAKKYNESARFEKEKSRSSCPYKKSTSISKDKHKCMHCAKMKNKTAGLERKKTKGFCPKKSPSTQKEETTVKQYECLCAKKSNESAALEKRESRGFCPFKEGSSTSNEEITASQCKCSHCIKMRNKTATLEKEKSKGFSPSKTSSTTQKERTVQHECLCAKKYNESARYEKQKSKKSTSTSKDKHECIHCAKMNTKTAGLERKKSTSFCPKKSPSIQKEETTVDQHECLCAEEVNKRSGPEQRKSTNVCPSSRNYPMDYCFNTNKGARRKRSRKENEPRKFKDSATVVSSHTDTCYSSRNSSQQRASKPQKKFSPEKKEDSSCLKKCCRCCKSCPSEDSQFCFCEDERKSRRRRKNKRCSCFKSCWKNCKSCFWDDTVFCDDGYTREEERKKKSEADHLYCTRIYRARKHVAKRTKKKTCSKIIQTDNICEHVPQEKKSFEVIGFSEKPVCTHSVKCTCINDGSDVSIKSENAKKRVSINIPEEGVKSTRSCTFKEKRSTNECPYLGMRQQNSKTECPYAQHCSSPNISVVVERKPLSNRNLPICKSRSESTVRSRSCNTFTCRYKNRERIENMKQCLEQWKNTNRLKNVQRRQRTEEAIEKLRNIDFKDTLERWRQARRLRRGNRNHAQVMLTNTAVSVLGGLGGIFRNSWSFFDDAQCDEECERRWKTYKKLAAMDLALEEEEAKRNKREEERRRDEERQILRRKAEDEQYDDGPEPTVRGKCKKCKNGTTGGRGAKKSSKNQKKVKTGKMKGNKIAKGGKKKEKTNKKIAKKKEKKKVKKEKKKKKKDESVAQSNVKGYQIGKLSAPTKHSFSDSQKEELSAYEKKQDDRLRKLHAHIDKHIDKLKRQQAKREKKNAAKEKEADTFHQLMHSMKTKKVIKDEKQNTDLHKKEIDYLKKKIKSEKEKYKQKNLDVQKDMDKAIENQLRKLRESNEIRRKKALEQIQEIEKQNQMYNEIQKKHTPDNKKGERNKAAAQRKVAARKEYLRKVKEKERLLFEKFKKEQEEANEAFRKKKLEHENKAKLKIQLQQDKENRQLSKLREQLRKKELQASNKVRRKTDESAQGRQQMLQLIMKQKQQCTKKKTKLEEKYRKRNTKVNKALHKINILSQKYDDKIQKKKNQQCELKEKEKRAKIILAQKQQQKEAQRRKKEMQRLRIAMEKLDKTLEKNKKMQQDKLSKINEKYKQTGSKKEVNLKREDSLKKLEAKLTRKAEKRRIMIKEREQMEKLKMKHYEMQKAKLNSST